MFWVLIKGLKTCFIIAGPLKPTETLAPCQKASSTPSHKLTSLPTTYLSYAFVEKELKPSLKPSIAPSSATVLPRPIELARYLAKVLLAADGTARPFNVLAPNLAVTVSDIPSIRPWKDALAYKSAPDIPSSSNLIKLFPAEDTTIEPKVPIVPIPVKPTNICGVISAIDIKVDVAQSASL